MRRKGRALRGKSWRSLVTLLILPFLSLASPAQFVTSGGGSNGSSSSGSSGGTPVQATPAQVNNNTYQGSIVKQAPVPGVLPLSLDQAISMGLKYNLGLVLSGVNAGSAS